MDIVNVGQLARSLALSRAFAGRVYSAAELKGCEQMPYARRCEFLAGRFAVKEAVLKVLRTGAFGPVRWTDIETLSSEEGAPELRLWHSAQDHAAQLSLTHWDASISHESGRVIALVAAY